MTQSNGNSRTHSESRPPGLTVGDLSAAAPYLRAPFPADTVAFQARRMAPSSPWAVAFATLSVWDLEERLDLFVGPDNWEVGEPSVLDDGHVTRWLTVFGKTARDTGDGRTRAIQASNAEKRCMVHFGLARYLKMVRPARMRIGDGPDQIPVTAKGHPYIPDRLLPRLQAGYERELRRLGPRFGAPLIHPRTASRAAEQDAASPAGDRPEATAGPSPHGMQVRNAAAQRGLDVAQLANVILVQAGEPPRSPRQAAAVLERLLARMPADIAERVLGTLALDQPTVAQAAGPQPSLAPAAAAPRAVETVSIDFSTLGPVTDSQAGVR
jgi:hypothetical protein